MRERHRILFNPRTSGLLIAGAFFLLLSVLFGLRASGPRPAVVKVKVVPVETSNRAGDLPPVAFDSVAYYQTIIENNLFRPLGWRPPVPREPYRLLGTVVARDADTPPQAIIESTTGETTYIVTTGEPLDASTEVVSIESKSVTLSTNGQQRTLHLPSGF